MDAGRDRVICCWEVDGVLVDPGPEATLSNVLDALGGRAPEAILLTHIHFDHAGASGALVRRFPGIKVYVHERGARHMIDPSRLVASAAQLYGGTEEHLRRRWGSVDPVPAESIVTLSGGESLLDGQFEVVYTPGHASHHVCYRHVPSGRALVGDMAGVRIPPSKLTVAPTPPPDIDIAAWELSIEAIAAWEPTALCLTHFGLVEDVDEQFDRVRARLREEAELQGRTEIGEFEQAWRELLQADPDGDPETVERFLQGAPPEHLWLGLRRWRDKHGE